ncbi:MAG TPA: D-alanyl-D-alanine carboxypeptidase family protein [Usitatibacter sp.]|jgi:D-alanyl-D-alanine carboxypeptidase (penicillin-binding protein 5/6)|nr:D-alanyl-D-alanine carboxypeptidase family protein [Usitatibacter sp.]
MKRVIALAAALLALAAHGQAVTPPPIAARAYILVDAQNGQVLAAAAEKDRFEPASLTKLMTAWLVFDALRAGRIEMARPVAVSEAAAKAGGARMFLSAGQRVPVADLLRGMIVVSANDAAIALAEAVAGSEAAFVARMNAQAAKMGLADTQFANVTGSPAPGHTASARDIATLAQSLIREFPEHYPLYAQKEFAYAGFTQGNRNRLLWTDPSVDGMKTGFTENAGYCLVASARRGERRLVSVVLGATSDTLRTAETQKLLNFGFQAYDTRRLYKRGDAVATPEIYKGTSSTVRVGFDRDVWLTLPRERFTGITAVLETRQPFVAPLAAGEKAGIMKLMRDNAPVAVFPVVALEDVPVAGFLSRGWDTLRLLFRSP